MRSRAIMKILRGRFVLHNLVHISPTRSPHPVQNTSGPPPREIPHDAREPDTTSYRSATTTGSVIEQQWARVKGAATGGTLRRGAWYRVLTLSGREAVVAVEEHQVRLPRGALEYASVRPHTWTLVPTPATARGMAVRAGELYAVCPGCRSRAPLSRSPQSLRCPRCKNIYKVGWEEGFIRGRR